MSIGLDAATWQTLFRYRDIMAGKMYRKFRERIPLQEFLSEGNETLAYLIGTWDDWHRDQVVALPTVAYRMLAQRMYRVVRKEWGEHVTAAGRRRWNEPRACRPVQDTDQVLSDGPMQTHCDIQRLLAHIEASYPPRAGHTLLSGLAGESARDHARDRGTTHQIVFRIRARLVTECTAWVAQGGEASV